jgi:predicted  nucleic acid-binding Zn-ribbon protein
MSEIEQLRKEISDLRERLARLEARKGRLEDISFSEHQRARHEWLQAYPMPQPMQIRDIATNFPPGTVLC